jgi:methylthioribose-1-phosphate isomerase
MWMTTTISPLRWQGDAAGGVLILLDQTELPVRELELRCTSVSQVWEAIKRLAVRGAPAIGVAAAYGVVLGARAASDGISIAAAACQAADYLATSRPTAVNLFWALERMRSATAGLPAAPEAAVTRLLAEAQAIHDEDRQMCHAIGAHGAALVPDTAGVLTHCNAGGLATAELGTALAVIVKAHQAGKRLAVYADETRPLLQGARLTAWELMRCGIDTTLICDNMAAQVMKEGRIDLVVVGADRIAANGDAANKIGTYGVALLAKAHGIPFYVAAPSSTFDLTLPSGEAIPIEQRDGAELVAGYYRAPMAPAGCKTYNPAFDVTPHALITALITEVGVLYPPFHDSIRHHLGAAVGVAKP